MSVSSAITYVKENPFFVAGCVASAVSNPILFGASAWAGALFVLFQGEQQQISKTVPQFNPNGHGYDAVCTRDTFRPFEIGRINDLKSISSISSLVVVVATKIQALRAFDLLKMGMRVSSCFSGVLLGIDLLTLYAKKCYAEDLALLDSWEPNNDDLHRHLKKFS